MTPMIFLGVFTGYNTLNMALVLPDNGRVIACDINEDYVKIGKPLWKEVSSLSSVTCLGQLHLHVKGFWYLRLAHSHGSIPIIKGG